MKTKKKNRFLTFCFSLMPGAGEMYMGFMKSGICLMLLFVVAVAFTAWLQQAVVSGLALVVWAYSFFHANHLASLDDEEFKEVKDEYLMGMDAIPGITSFVKNNQKVTAGILIFVGICLLWSTATNLAYDIVPEEYRIIPRLMDRIGSYVPSVLIGLGIIGLGIRMIKGKNVELTDAQGAMQQPDAERKDE